MELDFAEAVSSSGTENRLVASPRGALGTIRIARGWRSSVHRSPRPQASSPHRPMALRRPPPWSESPPPRYLGPSLSTFEPDSGPVVRRVGDAPVRFADGEHCWLASTPSSRQASTPESSTAAPGHSVGRSSPGPGIDRSDTLVRCALSRLSSRPWLNSSKTRRASRPGASMALHTIPLPCGGPRRLGVATPGLHAWFEPLSSTIPRASRQKTGALGVVE